MKEFIKKCENCKYLGTKLGLSDQSELYSCTNDNNILWVKSLDNCCKDWEGLPVIYKECPDEVKEGQLLSEEEHCNLTEAEKDSVREIAKVLEFINQNKLQNVNFKYDQVRGLASIHGIKDGYKYSTMISFKRGDKQDDK